ncbi:MAG: hypothetical protein KC931_08900, partial [Candidatus Omnitrophica bacterium]|nr:hypothetical protein [Candidatus Omnitrophota bacterium]
ALSVATELIPWRGGLGAEKFVVRSKPEWCDAARDGFKPRRYTHRSLLKQTLAPCFIFYLFGNFSSWWNF